MPVQDDAREREMVSLFNLRVPVDRSRSGVDAYLHIDGRRLPFELKSTTSNSVSTVRDFGADHIAKWRDGLHWLFGFYDSTGTRLSHCYYASPSDIEPWIAAKERYVLPDLTLAGSVPRLVTSEMVIGVFGKKEVYSRDDARWLMKKQWPSARYAIAQDLPEGYSLMRMTEMMAERCEYVIKRGATLNNPHIPSGFFTGLQQITEEHAETLRSLVRSYLASRASETDEATA